MNKCKKHNWIYHYELPITKKCSCCNIKYKLITIDKWEAYEKSNSNE